MNRSVLVALCLGLGVSTSASAYDTDMIKKGRELGLSVGNAYVCADADAKAALKADSEAVYAQILHDLGPSYAYVYAVSVGFGAAEGQPALLGLGTRKKIA
jgi:hypothetical protein